MTRHRSNNLSKTLKDYAVPFIGLFLISVLLFSVFLWWNESNDNTDVQWDNINLSSSEVIVTLDSDKSKAYIIYESWKKVEVENSVSLQKSEKILVESWNVSINFPFFANVRLKENWELLYKDDWSIFLESWNLWIESMKDIEVFMKYANISIDSGSIINLSQNEIESIVYSIDWGSLVSNLAWISTILANLEKITISSKVASDSDIDLELNKKEIDDYFKLSSWFKLNGWDFILNKVDTSSLSWSLTWDKKLELTDSSELITFDNITDESYVKTNPVDLVWRYSSLKVWKVTINNIEVKLNNELWTFSLKWFILDSKINDIVVKIYNNDWDLISKKVLTLYSNNWSTSTSTTTVTKVNKTLENYPVKATDFIIYEPTKTGKITTTSSRITIRWKVTNESISSVLVNDYKLKSYNWSTWRYHAFVEQGTLKDGSNNYEIKYLDKDSKLIYKEYYSIYKEIKKEEVLDKDTWLISSEIKIN